MVLSCRKRKRAVMDEKRYNTLFGQYIDAIAKSFSNVVLDYLLDIFVLVADATVASTNIWKEQMIAMADDVVVLFLFEERGRRWKGVDRVIAYGIDTNDELITQTPR